MIDELGQGRAVEALTRDDVGEDANGASLNEPVALGVGVLVVGRDASVAQLSELVCQEGRACFSVRDSQAIHRRSTAGRHCASGEPLRSSASRYRDSSYSVPSCQQRYKIRIHLNASARTAA